MKNRKKRWVWVVVLILVFGFVGACSSGEDTDTKKEADQTTEEKQEKKEDVIYHIGDVVTVGDVEYIVNGIEQSSTVGNQYLNTTAQNQFLIVSVTLTNKGTEALDVSSSFFKLKSNEKTYEASSDASVYLAEESIAYESINPDASFTGKIAFDVTQETIDASDLQLQVQTGAFGTETGLISLH